LATGSISNIEDEGIAIEYAVAANGDLIPLVVYCLGGDGEMGAAGQVGVHIEVTLVKDNTYGAYGGLDDSGGSLLGLAAVFCAAPSAYKLVSGVYFTFRPFPGEVAPAISVHAGAAILASDVLAWGVYFASGSFPREGTLAISIHAGAAVLASDVLARVFLAAYGQSHK